MKRSFIKSNQSLGKIIVIVALFICLGSIYQVKAAPPIQREGPPDPSPTPAIDIQTKLQPYQLPGIESSQANGRSLEVAPLSPEVSSEPAEIPGGQFVDIRAKLQPYQTPELEPSQADGRLLKESTLRSEAQESSVGALPQQTFNAVADAIVMQGYPTLNFGNTTDMWAGYDDGLSPDGRIARSLIRFNLANLPPNQLITKATLRVRLISSRDFPDTSRTITTYRIASNWSENSVNWNNKPGFGSAYGSKSIVHGAWDWYEFDVTNLVKAWYNGTYTNYGIMLRGPEFSGPDSSWRGFSTGEGPFTPQLIIEYTAPPNPPSNLTATAVSDTQNNLSWQDNSTNETGFKIERSFNGTTGWQQIATVGANVVTYSNIGLTCNTVYYYRVRASNATGNSVYSNIANAIPTCPPQPQDPASPTNLIATAVSTTQSSLSWQDNSTNETGFKIERSLNGTTGWQQIATVGANVVTYSNIGLTCGTTYYYRVRAYNASGDSNYSNTANTTTSDCSYSIYLPSIFKDWSPPPPTPTPIPPTPGPTPPPGPISFVGTTNQSRSVDLDIKPDLSAVTRFRLDAKVECPGVTSEGAVQISNPTGWPITNRQFEIRTSAGGGEEDVFAGEFDPTFSSVQGTWLRWTVIFDQPICSNTGTWSASRQ